MEDEAFYRWVTHGRSTCERCAGLEGREMSLADWRSRVLPGIHAGCDCSLEPVDELHPGRRVVRTSLKLEEHDKMRKAYQCGQAPDSLPWGFETPGKKSKSHPPGSQKPAKTSGKIGGCNGGIGKGLPY